MHNIPFDESKYRGVLSRRVSTLEDHTPPTQVEEQVIMTNVQKHLATLVDATRVYDESTSSSAHFLIAENEGMVKELQTTKQGGYFLTMSSQVELKKEILDEEFSLDIVMRALYSKFGTMHKEVIHLNRW